MKKQSKNFDFLFPQYLKTTENGREKTIPLFNLQITGVGYYDGEDFDYDIDTIMYQGVDIRPVLDTLFEGVKYEPVFDNVISEHLKYLFSESKAA